MPHYNEDISVPIRALITLQILDKKFKKKFNNAIFTTKCYNNFTKFLN